MVNLIGPDWKINKVESVIFDKDGTLIDLHEYWGRIVNIRAELLSRKYPLPVDQLCLIMGYNPNGRKLLSEGPVGLYSRKKVIDITINKCVELYGVHIPLDTMENLFDLAQVMFQTEIYQHIKVLTGVKSFLASLHQNNVKMGIVTSDSLESTHQVLEYLGIQNYFTSVVGRESCTESKDSGIPCSLALEELEANPMTTITVGDAPVDLVMGQKRGCLAGIGVTTGQTSYEELYKYDKHITTSLLNVIVEVGE
jgi:phosphoglycolate phosphatase-like HAD superfamily hydrolase